MWDVVDAMHNYTMALRHVRPDDWTGELMLRTVHDCRMFAHPSFDTKQQRSILMDFFDQVLRFDAMRGRARKPPMDRTEMLDLAKKLLFRKGIDGLTSFIAVEPYSRGKTALKTPNPPKDNRGNGNEDKSQKSYSDMTVEEKVRKCYRAFNLDKGCSMPAGKCHWKH